jgi:LPXTG-site transpeptidase (sortase) family protein
MRSSLTPPSRNGIFVWLERALLAASLVGIAAWGATAHERARFQEEARRRLDEQADLAAARRGEPIPGGLMAVWHDSLSARPLGAGDGGTPAELAALDMDPLANVPIRLAPDQPFGTLEIPRLGVDVVIVEGTSHKALKNAIGHLESTAWPGQRGTAAIAGHRDTFFRPLKDIALADTLAVVTPERRIEYVVDSLLVLQPHETEFMQAADGNRLLLITCYPFYYVGNAPKRFIVQARPLPERTG